MRRYDAADSHWNPRISEGAAAPRASVNCHCAKSEATSYRIVDDHESYLEFALLGVPLFAVPSHPRKMRLIALRRLQPTSLKRRLYRYIVGLSLRFGLDWVWSTPTSASAIAGRGIDFSSWAAAMGTGLGYGRTIPLIFWPRQPDRRRVYVHLLTEQCKAVGFAKISLDDYNSACLERERAVLADLANQKFAHFRTPNMIAEGSVAGRKFLMFEPLPLGSRPIANLAGSFPTTAFNELAGQRYHVSFNDVSKLSWWNEYEALLDERTTKFHAELILLLQRHGIYVCRAHGDATPANMLMDGSVLWMLDWEESRCDAPERTDKMRFIMAINGMANCRNSRNAYQAFKAHYLKDGKGDSRVAAMAATAYAFTMRHQNATAIIHGWEQVK